MELNSQELAAVHAASVRVEIPYTLLRLSETYQARRAVPVAGDPEMLSLKAHVKALGGLLQNLVVVALPDGTYEVCAGGRRWTVIGLLIDDGTFAADYAVPCLVIPAGHAHHASLIENVARKAMHPAEVFRSYARLRADGWTVAAIAAAHGADEKAVKKLLALGGVSPALMDLFQQDKIDLEEMRALASVADHGRQEAAWKAAQQGYGYRPSRIRQILAETELKGDSAVARYVTLAAYEKAGGTVRRDLFQNDVYLDDPEKVRSMALTKMPRSKLAKEVAAEGWGWVDYQISFDQNDRKRFGEIQRSHQPPTKAQAKQIDSLARKVADAHAKLAELEQADNPDEAQQAELYDSIEGWEGQEAAIRAELYDYPADLKALAGVVLHIDYSGSLTATRGLIRQEDREAVAARVRQIASEADGGASSVDLPPVKTRPVHSEALSNRLQAQRVIAVQAEIIQRPNLVLCLLIEQLLREVGDVLEHSFMLDSFDLSASNAHFDLARTDPAMEEAPAWKAVKAAIAVQTRDVPTDRNAVLPWLLERAQSDNIELLAVLLSVTVRREHYIGSSKTTRLDRLGRLVGLDMAKWWTPTADAYLKHVSKERIAAVVTEAVGADDAKPLLSMKKGQAAEAAEKMLEGRGWVPEVMRASAVEPDSQTTNDDEGDDQDMDDE